MTNTDHEELYRQAVETPARLEKPHEPETGDTEQLQVAFNKLSQEIDKRLETRPDGRTQKDHLAAVTHNIHNLREQMLGRKLTERERIQDALFGVGHDAGKYVLAEARQMWVGEDGKLNQAGEGVCEKIGINSSKGEKVILLRALESSGAFHNLDIGHHLVGAMWLYNEYQKEGGSLNGLPEEEIRLLVEATTAHQTNVYYKNLMVGINNGTVAGAAKYSEDTPNFIQRPLKLEEAMRNTGFDQALEKEQELVMQGDWQAAYEHRVKRNELEAQAIHELDARDIFIAACRYGDVITMAEVTSRNEQGALVPGGYVKLVDINWYLTVVGVKPGMSIEDLFESAWTSVEETQEVLRYSPARIFFEKRKEEAGKLKEGFLNNVALVDQVWDELEQAKDDVQKKKNEEMLAKRKRFRMLVLGSALGGELDPDLGLTRDVEQKLKQEYGEDILSAMRGWEEIPHEDQPAH